MSTDSSWRSCQQTPSGDYVDRLLVAIPGNWVVNSSKCRLHGNAPGVVKG